MENTLAGVAGKKFILSYSCGKDSTLCLHKMLEAGAEPMALLVMFNPEAGRSYFHGVDPALLKEYGEALELPLLAVPTGGEEYHLSMEAALRRAKEQGAELVCFGDIDIENNRAWGEERCRNVGLEAVYPLWHHDRQENVREVLELGYRCLIKTLDRRVLPRHLLGRVMDRAMVEEMTACGVDVCGENGEFHTIAVDGPVFHRPIPYCVRQLLDLGDYSVADITVRKRNNGRFWGTKIDFNNSFLYFRSKFAMIELKIKAVSPLMGTKFPLPAYATAGAAAMDLCACMEEPVTLAPGGRQGIPTGIAIALPGPEYVALVCSRSGMGTRHGITLSNSVGVIDSDYRGELTVGLVNHGDVPYTIQPGDRIAQLMVLPILRPTLTVVEELDETERGSGGFGSTGR